MPRYEDVKTGVIDNEKMVKEFIKCKDRLEASVSKKIESMVESKEIEILKTGDLIFYKKDDIFIIDSSGYIYDTKCFSIDKLEILEAKNIKHYTDKYNKKKYKTGDLVIPDLIYIEIDGYIYKKNKEVSTLLNTNKFVSDRLARYYNEMVFKCTSMGNYYGFSDGNKNDMVSNALFKILRKGFKYDARQSTSMFSYFTYIITNEFNETCKKQWKLTNDLEVSLDSMLTSEKDS